MKRLTKLLLASTLPLTMLVGCGDDSGDDAGDDASADDETGDPSGGSFDGTAGPGESDSGDDSTDPTDPTAGDDTGGPTPGTPWTNAEFEDFIYGADGSQNQDLADQDVLTSIEWGAPDFTPLVDVTVPDGLELELPEGAEENDYIGAVDPEGDDWTAAEWIHYGGDDPTGIPPEDAVPLDAQITGDTTLTAGSYILVANENTYVEDGVLTIEAGVTIYGPQDSALIITDSASLVVNGTAEAPVIMTSATANKAPGDWGGLVMVGDGPTNQMGEAEGFDIDPPTFGGEDTAHNCGNINYLSVRYAGFEVVTGSELNAITFYGCGTDTEVHYAHVFRGSDDGIECFGGVFDMDHVVVVGGQDDSLDFDLGYQGLVQYAVIQQFDDDSGDNALEWSSNPNNFELEPRTFPKLVNATVVGGADGRGATFKEGVGVTILKSIFVNFSTELFLLQHAATQSAIQEGSIAGNIFADVAPPVVDAESFTE